jgi:RNA polymerase sigma-70 factor (ECF subfamily)
MDEQERFARCWTAAQPAVANFIFAAIPDFAQAEDVLQEVAVALFRKFQHYAPERPFIPWALGIAKFQVLASKRKQARSFLESHPELLESVGDLCFEMKSELDARSVALQQCLRKLEEQALELIELRYGQGLAPRQIAQRFESTSLRIRAKLNRIRSFLRACIERQLRSNPLPFS